MTVRGMELLHALPIDTRRLVRSDCERWGKMKGLERVSIDQGTAWQKYLVDSFSQKEARRDARRPVRW